MGKAGSRIAEKAGRARVLVAEAPALRFCMDCGADISHRHEQAKICEECGTERRREAGRRGGNASKIDPYHQQELEAAVMAIDPGTPRGAFAQACMTANRKMWSRERNALMESDDVPVSWTKLGIISSTERVSRKCLGCGNRFESTGPENRICGSCKNSSSYASSPDD